MRKLLAIVALAAVVLAAAAPGVVSGGSERHFRTSLSGFLETPSISTTGRGSFSAFVDGSTIHYRLRYSGLSSTAMAAHIHLGRPDVAGGVSAFLCGGGDKPACPASGEVTGVIDAADVIGPAAQGIAPGEFAELVRAMRAGATYVNVHTELYPGGEIRGNLQHDD